MTKEEIIEECKQRLGFETDYEMYTLCRHEKDFYNAIIKALEQQPSDDVMAIHTQGLAEGIRCAMCTNSMKSDRSCDGGCVVDEDMYKKVMKTINNQMFSQPTSDDCVSRQAVIEYIEACGAELGHDIENESVREDILNMPSVTPNSITVTDFADKCRECGARYGRLLEQSKWISVSERFPDPQEDGDSNFTDWVQVSIKINPYQSIVCSAYYCFSEKKWYMERFGCGEVIAWQPLPKPYEEK